MLVSFLVKIVTPVLEPEEVKAIAGDMNILHDKMLKEGKQLIKYNKAVKRGTVKGQIQAVPFHLRIILLCNKAICKVFLFIFGFFANKRVEQLQDKEHDTLVSQDKDIFVHYYMKWRS